MTTTFLHYEKANHFVYENNPYWIIIKMQKTCRLLRCQQKLGANIQVGLFFQTFENSLDSPPSLPGGVLKKDID